MGCDGKITSMHKKKAEAKSYSFFFNVTPTTEIYTLSLHDALPISGVTTIVTAPSAGIFNGQSVMLNLGLPVENADRKSTRLNSSHSQISYAVFCLKKKNNTFYT